MKPEESGQKSQKGLIRKMAIADLKKLESIVEWYLVAQPKADIAEIPNLSEDEYNQLKKILGKNYWVNGVVNIPRNGNGSVNYTLHITRRK